MRERTDRHTDTGKDRQTHTELESDGHGGSTIKEIRVIILIHV